MVFHSTAPGLHHHRMSQRPMQQLYLRTDNNALAVLGMAHRTAVTWHHYVEQLCSSTACMAVHRNTQHRVYGMSAPLQHSNSHAAGLDGMARGTTSPDQPTVTLHCCVLAARWQTTPRVPYGWESSRRGPLAASKRRCWLQWSRKPLPRAGQRKSFQSA